MAVTPLLQAAGSATILILAACSGRNMMQTQNMVAGYDGRKTDIADIAASTFAADTAAKLGSMSRRDLLEVFLQSKPPKNVKAIEGEWNAYQPDNNGIIMTAVSSLLTNRLFGRGRTWNGKAFREGGQGINRFYGNIAPCEEEHVFDYALQSSKLQPGTESIVLDYSPYQSPFSLWKTMQDEVRVVPCLDGDVLVGFGCMSWSGGMLNSSPFVLHKAKG